MLGGKDFVGQDDVVEDLRQGAHQEGNEIVRVNILQVFLRLVLLGFGGTFDQLDEVCPHEVQKCQIVLVILVPLRTVIWDNAAHERQDLFRFEFRVLI